MSVLSIARGCWCSRTVVCIGDPSSAVALWLLSGPAFFTTLVSSCSIDVCEPQPMWCPPFGLVSCGGEMERGPSV